ncbi:hypothetical protein ABU162_02080 [Paenibacillus thiaminolyticus]|uniref:hypothetical protein n=1 Tax=Paenibacillus thiaminolyticus TaxID=49283 RepID=UPI0035A734B5
MAKAPFLYFTTYAEQGRIMKYEEAGEGMYGGSSRVMRERAAAGMSAAARGRCSLGRSLAALRGIEPGERPVAAWTLCSIAGRVGAA